jgi:hypothetical protein
MLLVPVLIYISYFYLMGSHPNWIHRWLYGIRTLADIFSYRYYIPNIFPGVHIIISAIKNAIIILPSFATLGNCRFASSAGSGQPTDYLWKGPNKTKHSPQPPSTPFTRHWRTRVCEGRRTIIDIVDAGDSEKGNWHHGWSAQPP